MEHLWVTASQGASVHREVVMEATVDKANLKYMLVLLTGISDGPVTKVPVAANRCSP